MTDRHAQIIRHFKALLNADPDRMFDVLELCKKLGVSDRTVRTCCKEVLATSPVRYLRQQRMHHARNVLLGADPASTSVTAVAVRFGFYELGRFSVQYKALFGELPSATLRRQPM